MFPQRQTDIQIREVQFGFEDIAYRRPYMFGGRIVDRMTMLNTSCVVRTVSGREAKGKGSMPLHSPWAFPSKVLSVASTLGAMKELASRIAEVTATLDDYGHPIDLSVALGPEYLRTAEGVALDLGLAERIPKLAVLVAGSAFDAAVHDAFGKVHARSCYKTYGMEFMSHDLSHYLNNDFKGEYLTDYVLETPAPAVPVYHSVGALDPLTRSDVAESLGDGLPEALEEWIAYDRLTHFKIKLNGADQQQDVERIVAIDRVVGEVQEREGIEERFYVLDFNEMCPDVEFLLGILDRIRLDIPAGFELIQFIEQPTARDLEKDRGTSIHEAARLKAMMIDESLTDLDNLMLAREMGYTGAALKACKGQSHAMLMAAAARKYGMGIAVMDLTCPGASLIHSAGIAAHVPGVSGIEHNSRQYIPAANEPWRDKYPDLFTIKDGRMHTGCLTRPGLGAFLPD